MRREDELQERAKLATGASAEKSLEGTDTFTNQWAIELGENLTSCRAKIVWNEFDVNKFLEGSPFAYTLSFIKPEHATVWAERAGFSGAWEHSVVAVFSDQKKQKLVDLFEIIKGYQHPLLLGRYEQELRRVTPGMKVEQVYKNLGRQRCDYEADSKGKWRVIFTYTGLRGKFIQIQADAATGTVLEVHDVTI